MALKLVNGLPVSTASAAYDESILYTSGLVAETNITLPNSKTFTSSSAKDLTVIVNGTQREYARDFLVVGAGAPYTQIKFIYDLSNNTVVRFKMAD